MRFFGINLFLVLLIFLFTGCAPAVNTKQLQEGVSHKDSMDKTLQDMEKDTNSQDEMWYWLNLGTMYQTKHDYLKSIAAFNRAEGILDEYENRAEISFRNIGSGVGSGLFSKGAETYYAKGYERTLMHTLNGMNYAMMGNFESAAVEMRKMEKRQEFWLKESEAKITEAKNKKNELQDNSSMDQIPDGYSMTTLLQDDEVRDMVNNYQDAFSYSISAIVSKISNNLDYAEISQKRAVLLSKDAEKLFEDNIKKDSVDVYVVVLSGQAPAQSIEKLRFPFPKLGYIVLDLPSLKPSEQDISSVGVYGAIGEAQAVRLLKTDKMAYKTLKDELPIEVTKSIVRATSKGVLTKQASDNGGLLGGLAATLIMDVTATSMEKSYRNWEMLPNSGFLSKISAKRGETVSIRFGGREESIKIPQETKNGSLVLISYLSSSNVGVQHVEY